MQTKKIRFILLSLVAILLCMALASCGIGVGPGTGGGETPDGPGTGTETPDGPDNGKEEDPNLNSDDKPLPLEEVGNAIIGANETKVGDYIISANSSDYAYIAIETDDIAGNKFLSLKKTDVTANTPLSVDLYAPASKGDWFTFATDIRIDSAIDTHTVLDISLGRMYNLRFVAYNGSILMCDFNDSGFVNLLDTVAEIGEKFTLFVAFNNGDGVTRDDNGVMIENDMQAYVYIDGRCVAKSTNFYSERHLLHEQFDAIYYSIPKSTVANVWLDNIITSKKPEVEIPASIPLEVDIPDMRSFWDDRLRTYSEIMGSEGAVAFVEACERMYGESLYEWVASLYDPDTGAFYFSESARDNFGFLPVVDNMALATNIIVYLGIVPTPDKVLAWEQMTKVASWAQLAHSNRDGYFYHPQWGTNVSNTRQNYDISGFEWTIDNYGFGEYFFSDAYFRAGRGGQRGKLYPITYKVTESTAAAVSRVVAASDPALASEVALAGMYDSANDLRAALDAKWEAVGGDSFAFASYMSSIASRIQRYGLSDACAGWLGEKQEAIQEALVADGKQKNGLWEKEVHFESVAAIYHLSLTYNTIRRPMEYPEQIIETIIDYLATGPDPASAKKFGMDYTYAPFTAIAQTVNNVETYRSASGRALVIFNNIISRRAVELVTAAEANLSLFKKDDGSYSYYPDEAHSSYQGILSSMPGTNEGDLYATYTAFTVRDRLLRVFKLPNHSILTPYAEDVSFDLDGDGVKETNGHLEKFQKLLAAVEKPIKKDPFLTDDFVVDFSSDADMPVNDYTDSASLEIKDGVLLINDFNNNGGAHIPFVPVLQDGSVNEFIFSVDVKLDYTPVKSNVAYQMFIHGGLKLDLVMNKEGTAMVFANRYFVSGSSTEQRYELTDKNGEVISVDPTVWFTVDIHFFPDRITEGDKEYFGYVNITQNGTTRVAYFENCRDDKTTTFDFTSASFYSLNHNTGVVGIDNVKTVNVTSTIGDYNFDRQDKAPIGVSGGEMVLGRDNMYAFEKDGTVSLEAKDTVGRYNFNEVQLNLQFPKSKAGDETTVTLKDSAGKVITALKLTHNGEYVTLTHAVNGQTIILFPADPNRDLTVRLEYHYDMRVPTLDVIVRYVDEPSGHSLVKPASIQNMPLADVSASAADFATVEVTSTSDIVYVDDAYVRNVKVN